MGPVQPGDWLASHPEPGQTFEQYLFARPVTPTGKRKIIYLLPVGEFTEKQEEMVRLTGEYLSLSYNRPVKSLPAIPLGDIPKRAQRVRPGAVSERKPPFPLDDVLPVPLSDETDADDRQILTTYLLDELLPNMLPDDGAALIALTASDLWPGPGWNFVFGQASLQKRVGVWSIHRNGNPAHSDDEYRLCLRRTLKTASHELGHMFTIQHCTAYECNMCGSNNRAEADRRPLAFCPECAAKVWWATQAMPAEHYRKLAAFCEQHKLEEDAKFYRQSAAALVGK
jgi:archaemetzincin